MTGPHSFAWLRLTVFLLLIPFSGKALAQQAQRALTSLGEFSLSLALAGDDVWLFEISPNPAFPDQNFKTSLMVSPEVRLTLPAGSADSWSSPNLTVKLSHNPPTITISRPNGSRVFSISPYAPDGQLTGLNFLGDFSHLFGLGADFRLSNTVFNLLGETILPGGVFGNNRLSRFGYHPNQVQAPILYGLGQGLDCGALFIDETLPLMWNLSGQPWTVSTAGPLGPEQAFRFFVIAGPDMPSLRQKFMNLVGRPPVPPRQALGVWASGVQGSTETEWRDRLSTLKSMVPGLAGLATAKSGALAAIHERAKNYNLRLLLDESAYVPQTDPLYSEMARRSFLVRQGQASGPIMVVNKDGLKSGLVDYTNSAAPTFWHSLFRDQLISAGISSFRLVDGDLEYFSPAAWYEGPSGGTAHSHYAWNNSYALKWLEGIEAGLRNQRLWVKPRLFLLSRTGTVGLSRFSGALYNGESFLFSGRSLLAVKAHSSLSGFDYYSSDLSSSLTARPLEQHGPSYDAWLAHNALTDFPLILPEEMLLRPGARYNLSLRENLSPYSYSLAWEAHLAGRPLIAPLAFHFQDDLTARDRMSELMLGPSLLLGLDFDGISERANVYVPKGLWYNWRTGEVFDQSSGGGLKAMDLKDAGQITPPILAKSGAIIPTLEEIAIKEGGTEKIPALKIFIGQAPSSFTWYEDDGETQNYLSGRFGKTLITAVTQADGSTVVTIKAREGSWEGAPAERRFLIDIYGPKAPGEATLDNLPHNRVARASELDLLDSGWGSFGDNRIRFKTPLLDMTTDHVFWFK